MKGIIALDIDGTLTVAYKKVDLAVANFLQSLVKEGWILVIITGRTFSSGFEAIKDLDFPYYLAVYNGSALFKMPEKELLTKKLISTTQLENIDPLFESLTNGYVIYTEEGMTPLCYYKPSKFPERVLEHLHKRVKLLKEHWEPLDEQEKFPVNEFSSLKYFGTKEETESLALLLEPFGFHAPVIKDPFNDEFYLIQMTRSDVNKGDALKEIKRHFGGVVIAAGDDYNDLPMLLEADVAIAMEESPASLLKLAHIIAPSAKENGIISGITKAISLLPLKVR